MSLPMSTFRPDRQHQHQLYCDREVRRERATNNVRVACRPRSKIVASAMGDVNYPGGPMGWITAGTALVVPLSGSPCQRLGTTNALGAVTPLVEWNALGLSRWYAGLIRQCYRPHPRHWQAPAQLVGIFRPAYLRGGVAAIHPMYVLRVCSVATVCTTDHCKMN